jgi:hypothetical protein
VIREDQQRGLDGLENPVFEFTTPLSAALTYAAMGWPVLPLHTPVDVARIFPGGCSCHKDHKGSETDKRSVGKHPRVWNGVLDATTDEAQIRKWWSMWPEANVGIDLEGAHLLDIAPDSPIWQAEFIGRGMPPTLMFTSGGGDGHEHHLYRLPEGGPVDRINKSGEYDIMSKGYAVAPPSLHVSGARYAWRVADLPLADPEEWAVAMLRKAPKERAAPTDWGDITRDAEFEELLRSVDQEVWRGAVAFKASGEPNRSQGLWLIGKELFRAGASMATVIHWLEERDVTLGWFKYANRPHADQEYAREANRAWSDVKAEPETVGAASRRKRAEDSTVGKNGTDGRNGNNGGYEGSAPNDSRPYTKRRASDVTPEQVDWMWRPRIPFGMVTILEGDPDQGKSLMTLDLIARLSTGRPMPDGTEVEGTSGPVVSMILTAEDSPEHTVVPRLSAVGADLDRVIILDSVGIGDQEREVELPRDTKVLRQAIDELGVRFIVVDVLMAYLGEKVNAHVDQDIRRALRPLARLALEKNVAIVVLRHITKGGGNNAMYRGGGGMGLVGAARSVLLAGVDPFGAELEPVHRLLARVKGNLAPPYPSFGYVIVDNGLGLPMLRWDKDSTDVTADDIHRAAEARAKKASDSTDADGPAETFLKEQLDDGQSHMADDIIKAGKKLGLAYKELWRASQKLGVVRKKTGFGSSSWTWTWTGAPTTGPNHVS